MKQFPGIFGIRYILLSLCSIKTPYTAVATLIACRLDAVFLLRLFRPSHVTTQRSSRSDRTTNIVFSSNWYYYMPVSSNCLHHHWQCGTSGEYSHFLLNVSLMPISI